jgi:integrase
MARPNKGPRLRRNKSGYYVICWTEKGRTRVQSTKTKTLHEAGLVLAQWADRANVSAKSVGGTRVGQILDFYWDEHAVNVRSSDSIKAHMRYIREGLGFHDARDLTRGDIATYIRKRRKGLLGERAVADGTIRRELGILKAAFAMAVEHEILAHDQLPTIKLPPMGKPRERYLSLDEIDRLLKAAATLSRDIRLSRIERFLWLALQTGARRDAILHLTWDRVDLERGLIDFRDPRLEESRKRRVVVPISESLMPVLRRAHAERRGQLVLDTTGPIRSVFDRACKLAGLEDVSPHVLRHTWASHASMNGVGLTEISRVLGNTLAVCEKVYAKYQPGYLTAAVNQAYGGKKFEIEDRVL